MSIRPSCTFPYRGRSRARDLATVRIREVADRSGLPTGYYESLHLLPAPDRAYPRPRFVPAARQTSRVGRASIIVDTVADPVAAFDFVVDPSNEPRWNTNAHQSELLTERPVRPGSTARTVGSMGGREMTVDITVETVERPHRTTTVATTGPMRFHTTYDISPTPAGSRITMTVDITASGVLRVIAPLITVGFARRLRRVQSQLRTALDSLSSPDVARTDTP